MVSDCNMFFIINTFLLLYIIHIQCVLVHVSSSPAVLCMRLSPSEHLPLLTPRCSSSCWQRGSALCPAEAVTGAYMLLLAPCPLHPTAAMLAVCSVLAVVWSQPVRQLRAVTHWPAVMNHRSQDYIIRIQTSNCIILQLYKHKKICNQITTKKMEITMDYHFTKK